jgi:hypothetical protein
MGMPIDCVKKKDLLFPVLMMPLFTVRLNGHITTTTNTTSLLHLGFLFVLVLVLLLVYPPPDPPATPATRSKQSRQHSSPSPSPCPCASRIETAPSQQASSTNNKEAPKRFQHDEDSANSSSYVFLSCLLVLGPSNFDFVARLLVVVCSCVMMIFLRARNGYKMRC